MSIEFVGDLPKGNRRGSKVGSNYRSAFDRLRDDLARQSGEWAEVQREPRERAEAARQRVKYLKKRGIEATSRMVGDECIVFARVVES